MKIWPNMSHTTLKACSKGALVRMVGSRIDNLLAIVCEDRDGGKGLIYLGNKEVVYWPNEAPGSTDVFLYEDNPVLLLDHASATASYKYPEPRGKMGLVVFVESGCYMNVRHATNKLRPEFRYDFERKTLNHAFTSDKGDGVVFRNWSLVLTNPHISHAKPLELVSMKLT